MDANARNGNTDVKSVPISTDCLNAVRVLHQTVVCLRTALEKSQSELNLLKSKIVSESGNNPKYENTIETLSLENHVLRRKIISSNKLSVKLVDRSNLYRNKCSSMDEISNEINSYSEVKRNEIIDDDARNAADVGASTREIPETGNVTEENKTDGRNFDVYKSKTDSEESEEVDNIELIFTTDDTKHFCLQEELEPISDDGEMYESRSEISQPKIETQSVLVETDISKCGIVYDNDSSLLSPGTTQSSFGGVPHRLRKEFNKKMPKLLSIAVKPPNIRSLGPTLNENVATVRDSEAQTEISAVPPHWKSESFLVNNKSSHNFPTLPSKFAIPVKESTPKYPLKLADKTQEARRILLSDINFTSMVPELSRSVDHLYQNGIRLPNNASPQSPYAAKFLKSPVVVSPGSSCSKFEFSAGNSSWNCYNNSFSLDRERSAQDLHAKRRSWRPSMFSLDAYYVNRTSSVPPSPTLRRHSAALSYSPSYGADTHFYYPSSSSDKFNKQTLSNLTLKNSSITSFNCKQKTKVSFKESCLSKNTGSRQSLPNMYVETESAEESTESLIDESEEYVRKSIDTSLSNVDWPYVGYRYVGRTYSVPNLFLEFSPPLSARPFIARTANDLKVNYFVKVINKEGRVVGGRIQFVGNLPDKTEPYVGLLLPPNMGENDGTFQSLRYFICERNCGLFVPFRKVVMAWKV